jgi:hypothetical protein
MFCSENSSSDDDDDGSDHPDGENDHDIGPVEDQERQNDDNDGNGDDVGGDEGGDDDGYPLEMFVAHGYTWDDAKPTVDVAAGKCSFVKPRVKHWNDGLGKQRRPLMAYWAKSFPMSILSHVVTETNRNLVGSLDHRARGRAADNTEVFKYLGIRMAMCLLKLSVDEAFRVDENDSFLSSPPNFKDKFGMAKNRFQTISMALSFVDPDAADDDDPWHEIRPLVDAFNKHRIKEFQPGEMLTIDESMSMWKGSDGNYVADGMPHVTKIQRKPEGVGLELKTLCDSASGVMLFLELMEGKDRMRDKEYADISAGTGHVLRATKAYHGTNRTIIGDSAFASVTTAEECLKHGLHFMGIVKTATRKFPAKLLKAWFKDGEAKHKRGVTEGWRGNWATASTDVMIGNVAHPIYACCWAEKKPKYIVSTRGTHLRGADSVRSRHKIVETDGRRETEHFKVPHKRSAMIEMLFDSFSAVDVANHNRQGTLAFERHWCTHCWWHRVLATILGICVNDAYCIMKLDLEDDEEAPPLTEFAHQLVKMITAHSFTLSGNRRARADSASDVSEDDNKGGECSKHVLKPLKDLPFYADLNDTNDNNRAKRRCKGSCRNNQNKAFQTSYYCEGCTPKELLTAKKEGGKADALYGIVCYCDPSTQRTCFQQHLQAIVD